MSASDGAQATSHFPLNAQRLSPLQVVLALATVLILLVVVALILSSFHGTTVAGQALASGQFLSDISSIERGVYRLHIATYQVLATEAARPAGSPALDTQALELELALLANQVRMSVAQTADQPELQQGLDALQGLLVEYSVAIIDLPGAQTPAEHTLLDVRLRDILARFEAAAQSMFDDQELRFYTRLARGLNNQRTSQAMLLVTAVVLVLLGASLALSMRRTLGIEFERNYAMLEALFRADEELHRNVQVRQVLEALVNISTDILGAPRSLLLAWSEPSDRYELVVSRGFDEADLAAADEALTQALSQRDELPREPVLVGDTQRDTRRILHLGVLPSTRAYVYLPVLLDEQVLAVLGACFHAPRAFDADDLRLMRALSRRASSALENARLYARAEETATLEERQRLARELHDAVTQTLFASSLIAEVLPRVWERSPEQGRARLAELQELTRGALAEMRTLLLELRPSALMEADLGDLMRQLAAATSGRSRIPVRFEMEGSPAPVPEVKAALYRVAQEALNNMVKHSGATQAVIRLEGDGERVHLCVSDDGHGFDPASVPANHLGLGIMAERAQAIGASYDITSAPGQGTRVCVEWPAPAEKETHA